MKSATTENSSEPDLTGRPGGAVRTLARLATRLVLGIVILIVTIVVLLQVPPVARWIAQTVLAITNPWKGTSVSIESVRGSWVSSLALRHVRIGNADGSFLMSIDTLSITYDPLALLGGEIHVFDLILRRPRIRTGVSEDGTLTLLEPFKGGQETEPDTSRPLNIRAGSLAITQGEFVLYRPNREDSPHLHLEDITLTAHTVEISGGVRANIDTLQLRSILGEERDDYATITAVGTLSETLVDVSGFTLQSPRSLVNARGKLGLPLSLPDLPLTADISLNATPLSYRDLHPFVGTFGPEGEVFLSLHVVEESGHLRSTAEVQFSRGGSAHLEGDFWTPREGTVGVHIRGETKELSVAAITGAPDTSERLNAGLDLRGEGSGITEMVGELSAKIVESYVAGAGPLSSDLKCAIRRDTVRLDLSGTLGQTRLTVRGPIAPFLDTPTYDLSGTMLVSPGAKPDGSGILNHIAGINGRFSVSGSGLDPTIAQGTVSAEGVWENHRYFRTAMVWGDLNGGTARLVADVKTVGGEAAMQGELRFGDVPAYTLDSMTFRNLDIAAFLDDTIHSSLTGSFTAHGSGTDAGTLSAEAQLQLAQSRLAHLNIESCMAQLRLMNGVLTVEGGAETDGGEIRVDASAEPFAEKPSARIRELTFRELRPGRLSGSEELSMNLNGTLKAEARVESRQELSRLIDGQPEQRSNSTRITADLVLEDSRWNNQELSGTIRATLLGREVGLALDIHTPGGGVVVEGTSRPFDPLPHVDLTRLQLDHVDLGAFAGLKNFTTDLTGAGSARLTGTNVEDASARFSLNLSQSTVNEESLHNASFQGTLERGKFSTQGRALFAHGRTDFSGEGSVTSAGISGKLTGALHIDDLRPFLVDDSISTGNLDVHLQAEGTFGDRHNTQIAGRLSGRGSLNSLQVDSILCRLSLLGRTIDVDTLLLTSNAGILAAGGRLAVLDSAGSPGSDFRLTTSVYSLKPLDGLAGLRGNSYGDGELSCTISGPPDDTRIAAAVRTNVAALGDISVTALEATASAFLRRDFQLKALEAHATVGTLFYGSFGIGQSAIDFSSDGRQHRLAASLVLEENSSSRLVGSLTHGADSTVVAIDTLMLVGPRHTWNLDNPATFSFGPKLRVNNFVLRSGGRKILLDGVLDREGEQDFTVVVDSLEFTTVARMVGRPSLGGTLSMDLRVTGPSGAARAAGAFHAEMLAEGRSLGTVETQVEWIDSLLRVEGTIRQPNGGQLIARATIPRVLSFTGETEPPDSAQRNIPERQMDLIVQAENFDLAVVQPFLNPKSVSECRGVLTADARGQGSPKALQLSGSIAVDSGLIRLPGLGVTYERIRVLSSIQDGVFRLEEASVRSGEGSATCTGVVDFTNLDSLKPDLRIVLVDFLAMQDATLKGTLSGDISVTGTLTDPVVDGRIALKDSYFMVPDVTASAAAEDVALTDEDYVMLAKHFAFGRRTIAEEKADPAQRLALDLDLTMGRNTWVRKRRNPTLAIELDGTLSIKTRPDQPLTIFGNLRPLQGRSYIGQFGREFEIKEGEIAFVGPPKEFELRMESEYKVPSGSGRGLSEVVIRMAVESKLGRFTFRLSSDPSMDEADILSYLATGKSQSGALANAGDQGNLAGAVALGQVVGAAGGLTEGKIPLDVFQIRQDGARGVTIVAGSYATPKTYLGIRQPILIDQGSLDSYYDVRTQFEVEYQASSWLYLNFQGGSSRTLLFLKSRYAY